MLLHAFVLSLSPCRQNYKKKAIPFFIYLGFSGVIRGFPGHLGVYPGFTWGFRVVYPGFNTAVTPLLYRCIPALHTLRTAGASVAPQYSIFADLLRVCETHSIICNGIPGISR
jgi:hypothetical protein